MKKLAWSVIYSPSPFFSSSIVVYCPLSFSHMISEPMTSMIPMILLHTCTWFLLSILSSTSLLNASGYCTTSGALLCCTSFYHCLTFGSPHNPQHQCTFSHLLIDANSISGTFTSKQFFASIEWVTFWQKRLWLRPCPYVNLIWLWVLVHIWPICNVMNLGHHLSIHWNNDT